MGKFGRGGGFGKSGESSVIDQPKTILTIDNLLADLLIRQTFLRQMLEKSQSAKLSPRQTFPLYGNLPYVIVLYYSSKALNK